MTRMITLISAKRGVGKSFLTANLGVLLAGKNQRVAMLDANINWPSLHYYFNLKAGEIRTFRDYIEGSCDLGEVCHAVTDLMPGVQSGGLDLIQAVLPVSEDVLRLGSAGLFVMMYPNHDFTKRMQSLASGSILAS